ncbi:AsmA family protein [Gilvimarinus xylanilyticus]|uniref:AsmA family protein n=1 Tax=Gilvimarinus xylanilyticus TaxID=2944139 RepID=A0A9X2KTF5_9GAMM|nr:AsmA family protein [Gilvimarinus xylanilyticus]MCP8898708.1 AsmA family protein [Gilvimarinus xylanilyticus]
MKAVKIILIILLVLVLLIGGGIYYLVKNLDTIVAGGIERIGTEVLQTEVSLDSANFELKKGRGELHGLSIANLEGFNEPYLFQLEQIALQVEPASLREPVIVIDEIMVDGLQLTVEDKGIAQTNMQELMQRLNKGGSSSSSQDSTGAEPRFMVEKLSFTDISMDLISPQYENQNVTLSDFSRTNLGDRETGLTAKELVRAIVQPVIDKARDRAEEEIRSRAQDAAQKAIEENLSEEDQEKVNQLKGLLGQ